jgi:hypothetical protein
MPPKDKDGPPSMPSNVNSWAQIVTQGMAKTSTDEVTQAGNNEDAMNTENINTIPTSTHTGTVKVSINNSASKGRYDP